MAGVPERPREHVEPPPRLRERRKPLLEEPAPLGAALAAACELVAGPLDPLELGLELKNFAFGGTLGVERRIDCGKVKDLSFGLQFNHNQSPHKPVGQVAIDGSRSDVTLGFSYLAKISGQQVLFQLYGREDINFSGGGGGYLTPYSPPDFQAGLRAAWMLE